MFSIGFPELCIVVLVALLVLGPERLPQTLRSAGRYWRRTNQLLQTAKKDLEDVMNTTDITQDKSETKPTENKPALLQSIDDEPTAS